MRVILANGSFSYIPIIKSAVDSDPAAAVAFGSEETRLQKEGKKEMFEVSNDLKSRQLLAVFFALVSGISAVSTAVLPGVFHI